MRSSCLFVGLLLSGLHALPGYTQGFEQQVAPFPVRDTSGAAYEMPFLGGFNTPRPKLVDIDQDGDLDLFVQERRGRLVFFENVGDPSTADFEWRSDFYKHLDVGAWAHFADLDDDGDPDLLTEEPISKVRYVKNTGTSDGPTFTEAAAPLRRRNGDPLFAERQNVLTTASMDCQGPPDLLLGGLDGRLRFARHTGFRSGREPVFELVTDSYQNVCVGPASVCGSSTVSSRASGAARQFHGANALASGDLEGDGDPDLLWGDFFSRSLYLIENTGSCGSPRLERAADVFPPNDPVQTSGYNAPALGDLDGDDTLDLLVGVLGGTGGGASAVDNFLFFENTGSPSTPAYVRRTRRFLPTVDVGAASAPAVADLNGDGRLDVVIGNESNPRGEASRLHVLMNVGTRTNPEFAERPDPLLRTPEDGFNFSPAFADVTGNGRGDLFVGTFDGTVRFYRNAGPASDPRFTRDQTHDVTLPRGNFAAPALVDIDADGDQDLFVGSASAEGTIAFFRNEGSAQDPDFVLQDATYGDLRVRAPRTHPSFSDVNADGIPDLILGMDDGIDVYTNVGTAQRADFASSPDSLAIPLRSFAAPAPADLDGDRRLDLLVGGESGGVKFLAGTGEASGPAAQPGGGVVAGPNPFSGSTRLTFSLTDAASVRLSVYDVMGRRVDVLVDRRLSGSTHSFHFGRRVEASGLYLYVLRVDGRVRDRGRLVHVR